MNDLERNRDWLTFSFDEQCRLTDRSLQFGRLPDAALGLFNASLSRDGGFDIACAILCSPIIAPSDLREVAASVAAVKLPYKLARILPPTMRVLWDSREPGQ